MHKFIFNEKQCHSNPKVSEIINTGRQRKRNWSSKYDEHGCMVKDITLAL